MGDGGVGDHFHRFWRGLPVNVGQIVKHASYTEYFYIASVFTYVTIYFDVDISVILLQ
jgi:hypothetical protein